MNEDHNYSPKEVEKFANLANKWWQPQGSVATLHEINPLRLSWIKEHIFLANKQVLDVGCGGGILSESMALAGAKVTGIDLCKPLIDVAKQHAKSNNLKINYYCTSITQLSTHQLQQFDIITAMELLEHIPNPQAMIQTMIKLVKTDGMIFLSTINRNLKSYLFAIIGAEYLLRLLPRGTHDYQKFILPAQIDSWARKSSWRINAIKGLGYHLITKRYYLNEDISVNYLVKLCHFDPVI